MPEVMRDILQSRYLRSNVAHKQLARMSLSRGYTSDFLLALVMRFFQTLSLSSSLSSSLFKLIYYKFMTSILQSLDYETYDVPLLAVSNSYSRRAVV